VFAKGIEVGIDGVFNAMADFVDGVGTGSAGEDGGPVRPPYAMAFIRGCSLVFLFVLAECTQGRFDAITPFWQKSGKEDTLHRKV
jgi:hypothetical protein